MLSVHAGFLSMPEKHPDSSFAYDFRTQAGTDLFLHFGNDVVPIGLINRKTINGSKILDQDQWAGAISNIINTPPDADISIVNEYRIDTRTLCTHVQSTFLKTVTGSYKLALYLSEDSIINWQRNYDVTPTDIPDYVHRHVLRTALNGAFGQSIASGNISSGTKFVNNFKIRLNDKWNAKHCSVVAILYDEATYEILQSEEVKVN